MKSSLPGLGFAQTLLFSRLLVAAPAARATDTGCADGQREGIVNPAKYPNIAGCSGGWNIPRVLVSTPGFAPACPGVPTYDTQLTGRPLEL